MKFLLFTFVGVVHLFSLNSGKAIYKNDNSQRTFQEIKEEVARYGDVAKAIINLAVYGKAQNRSYERLALLVDTVGPRPSGSKSLEKAIQIMYQNLQEDGLENVHLEPVKIPHWERGEESAVMLEPRIHKMAILGLGSSIGTPPEDYNWLPVITAKINQSAPKVRLTAFHAVAGPVEAVWDLRGRIAKDWSMLHACCHCVSMARWLVVQCSISQTAASRDAGNSLCPWILMKSGITAEVLVVTSFEELQRRAREARGKIVVYNQPYVNYSKTVQYRVQGAVEAAKVGALASLIRSVASFSVYRLVI
ncbi:hypothetical protein PANDA_009844 [Ailuropoda melanoleuca]|uniref:Carboxypeptidase Q n=1 Tax=Ailuropoda melanoleuca TaxID=9646 RepID=D2HFY0_AILME|nr:hypothetical protein PANDA_009844 [Ailuropoda melanoleuca]